MRRTDAISSGHSEGLGELGSHEHVEKARGLVRAVKDDVRVEDADVGVVSHPASGQQRGERWKVAEGANHPDELRDAQRGWRARLFHGET